ncbi:T9SS type B sorting domain-containing protein [Mariniflexile gromovii]|uniref:T9SS type B sorting domain-containing protein n=1 Tax=Mariniflexile gromovii TaxID=362523 RepID=A0ABS4BQP8_9FLAO|nr:T9SS type B sorting domain-containing protein [Mariniflexile gromovii]MBP0902904.1 T9SS type B sorting domain-containing protein [Mariniflexile gromovii]
MWVNKTYIVGLFLILSNSVGFSQNTFIPDANFEQALIDLGYDTAPLDNFVPTANISSITNLDVSLKNISDLTGIEDFVGLTVLDCSDNFISSLNVSQNTKLSQFFCSNNQLAILDISNLIDLNIFWCDNNQLSNLNVTQNTQLISLVCNTNQLSTLDVSKNTNLNILICENNQLSSIDITKNSKLSRFHCGNNFISNLDISKNLSLVFLSCENNQLSILNTEVNNTLSTVNCNNNKLDELDFSKNSNLTILNCSTNQLCRLNVKNGNNANANVNFSNNINLNCVVVDNPSNIPTNWMSNSFVNYVTSQTQCNDFVNIDTLNNVVTNTSYTLPALTYGNYFTESGGNGTPLFAGDSITTTQNIYIYNTSICATNESYFKVLIIIEDYFIPKFFTPNNDGKHDFWKVEDFKNTIKTITIFDRNGKLLKQLPANSTGWNGSFRGQPLASNDYWYAITLNTGETIKGHFTLKR